VAEGEPNFDQIQDLDQLPEHLLAELENFSTSTRCWSRAPPGLRRHESHQAALRELQAARDRAGHSAASDSLARCSTVMPSYHT